MINKVLNARYEQLQEMKGKAEEAMIFLQLHLGEVEEEMKALDFLMSIYKKRPENDPDLLTQYNEVIGPTIDELKKPMITEKERQVIQLSKKLSSERPSFEESLYKNTPSGKEKKYSCEVINPTTNRINNAFIADTIRQYIKENDGSTSSREILDYLLNKYPILGERWKVPATNLSYILSHLMTDVKSVGRRNKDSKWVFIAS